MNALHEAVDARNPGKLPRLVYTSNQQPPPQQQQQQQQQQQGSFHQGPGNDADFLFPDSLVSPAIQGPLFV